MSIDHLFIYFFKISQAQRITMTKAAHCGGLVINYQFILTSSICLSSCMQCLFLVGEGESFTALLVT